MQPDSILSTRQEQGLALNRRCFSTRLSSRIIDQLIGRSSARSEEASSDRFIDIRGI